MTDIGFTGVRAVSVPVADQQAALEFYRDVLGFSVVRDLPTPSGGRWIELTPGSDTPVLTLEPAPATVVRGFVGVRFSTSDAEALRTALVAAGVEADDILRWPGVPPMFAFRDRDGNAFSVTEV